MRFSKMGEFLLLLRTKQTCIESLLRKYFITDVKDGDYFNNRLDKFSKYQIGLLETFYR